MHLQPVFAHCDYFRTARNRCPTIVQTGLCLPSGSNMKESEIERVADTVLKIGDYLSR